MPQRSMIGREPAVICWFSCGAASAVAAKHMLEHPIDGMTSLIAYCDTAINEHADNERFLADCQRWLGTEIIRLRSKRFPSMLIDDVFRKERYLMGRHGAPCTRALKSRVRMDFQVPRDIHVFGYTFDELTRWHDFQRRNDTIDCVAPLVDQHIDKLSTKRALLRAGIALPAMYELGYEHNN